MVKNPPVNAGDGRELGSILGREDPLQYGIATHSSIARKVPWTEEPGGLQSMGLQRVGHTRACVPFTQIDYCQHIFLF